MMRAVLISSLALTTLSAPALAQVSGAQSMFDRNRNVSVMDRPRPEYDGGGVQSGALIFYPELTLGLEYTDNVFGASSNEESDVVAIITPSVAFETTWSRHAVTGDASVTRREYFDFSDESVWNATAGLAGKLDVDGATSLEAGARYSDLTEPRTSAGAAGQAAEPIEYDTLTAFFGAMRASGRFRLQGRVDYGQYDYSDAPLFGGGVADQDFRDRDQFTYMARGDYAVSPDTAVFLRAQANTREYDLAPPAVGLLRDSDGYTVDVGADFDINGVARGVIGVGYMEQSYDDASLPTIDGLSIEGLVEWFPTALTTVTASATRSIQDAAIANSGGYVAQNLSVNVDHELKRNVIVSAGLSLGKDEYSGIDREDDRWSANAGVTYFMNRNVGVRASYTYVDQDSKGLAGNQDYSRNSFGISIVLRR
ncbi:outer membrane beta-barrel protein [Oceanicaulis sp. LC35]|uniref:outer membrane beta-barrel protein n=1 Tax=Oceanicaulis sp. LC35 TaxID=3349635 RepID=UPI003F826057